jgi:predicted nicotinamide N-methyase
MKIDTKELEQHGTAFKEATEKEGYSDTDMNMESKTITPFLFVRSIPIYFEEDWRTGIGGGLWSTGLAMGKYFNTESAITNLAKLSQRCSPSPSSSLLSHERQQMKLSILELGSGNGFLAVCLTAAITSLSSSQSQNKFRISNLVITDEINHLSLIQKTIQNNLHAMECVDNLTIQEHQWGVFTDSNICNTESTVSLNDNINGTAVFSNNPIALDGTTKFDFIIGSDVAYHESLYQPLLQSLQQFSHDDTISLIGITMTDTKPAFFHQLDYHGFMYQKLADHLLDPPFRGTTFGIFAIQKT